MVDDTKPPPLGPRYVPNLAQSPQPTAAPSPPRQNSNADPLQAWHALENPFGGSSDKPKTTVQRWQEFAARQLGIGSIRNPTDFHSAPQSGSVEFGAGGIPQQSFTARSLEKEQFERIKKGLPLLDPERLLSADELARYDLRRDIAGSIQQSERSSEKPTVSEGPFPETLSDAARWLIGGVFVFVAGFEGYAMIWEGRIASGIASSAIAVVLTGLVVWWKKIPWKRKDIRWAFIAVIFAVTIIALSPFVEQHRWPFLSSKNENPAAAPGFLWPPLTDAQAFALERAVRAITKRAPIQIICVSANCRELAGNFISVFHSAGWSVTGNFSGYAGQPVGIHVYLVDINDHALADAIEASTRLKIESIEPTSIPNTNSVFIGIKP